MTKFKQYLLRSRSLVALIGVLTFIVFGATLIYNDNEVFAQSSGGSLSGYAWSSTIGWISLNGSGYGMSVNSSGTITGYAWSPNIGWVSANSSHLSGCPSSPCSARIDSDGSLKGWMRALAGGGSQSGGWDGFISLSGSNYGPVQQSDGDFSGYAWGSDVVGWVSFSQASTDFAMEPTAELRVRTVGDSSWETSLTIEPTEEIELAWNQSGANNTESCQAVPPAFGFSTDGAVSGIDSTIEAPVGNSSRTYRIICYSSSGEQKVSTVNVTSTGGVGARFCPGTKSDFVRRDANVSLCWEVGTNSPDMCSIKAGGIDILNPVGSETGSITYPVVGEVTFTLQCIGGDGDTMTTKVLPEVQET